MKQFLPSETQLKPETKIKTAIRIPHAPARIRPVIFPRCPKVSPSLRLRATAANRSLLRWMRAAELAAWHEAGVTTSPGLNAFQH